MLEHGRSDATSGSAAVGAWLLTKAEVASVDSRAVEGLIHKASAVWPGFFGEPAVLSDSPVRETVQPLKGVRQTRANVLDVYLRRMWQIWNRGRM